MIIELNMQYFAVFLYDYFLEPMYLNFIHKLLNLCDMNVYI